jgi:uncharacterized protein YukE
MSHDYRPLGSERDLPGDPGQIRALARRYIDTADEIVAAADRLYRMGSSTEGVWKGLAGQEFPNKARDLSARIRKAETRYRETGEALTRFADRAEHAQDHAARAAERYRAAQDEIAATVPSSVATPGLAPTPEQAAADRALDERHNAAKARAKTAHDDFHDARRDYETAARDTHNRIHDASHDDGLRDSWWYRHWHAISRALMVITVVLMVVGVLVVLLPAVLTMAGLTLSIGALETVAAVGATANAAGMFFAVVTLGADVQAKLAGRDVSTTTLVLDALVPVTFGLSRYFSVGERLGELSVETENAAKATRGSEAFLESMAEYEAVLDRTPTFIDYLIVDSLRPLAVERALASGSVAIQELEESLTLAGKIGDSPAVRLLLREHPEEIFRLARAAAVDPAFAGALVKGLGLSAADNSHVAFELLSARHAVRTAATEQADAAHTEARVEAITEEVRRYVLSTP